MTENLSAERAHGRMDTHEGICAERYNNIAIQLASMHDRLNAISNRMWLAACGLIVMAVGGVASLLVILLTRGKM